MVEATLALVLQLLHAVADVVLLHLLLADADAAVADVYFLADAALVAELVVAVYSTDVTLVADELVAVATSQQVTVNK